MSRHALFAALAVAVLIAIFPLNSFAADCNANGVDDLLDIAGGTSADCNGNSVPDECDIASGTSQDCNGDGLADDCAALSVDVVVVIDVSESSAAEQTQVCVEATGLADELAALDVDVSTLVRWEIVNSGFGFPCVQSSIISQLGSQVPGDGACGPLGAGVGQGPWESWAPASAVVAQRFNWRPGALRVIVPMSDEAGCQGDSICNSADQSAVLNAINVANANDVIVLPIIGPGATACVRTELSDLGTQTGGRAYDLFERPSAAIAYFIKAAIRARTNDCDDNGVLDACDIGGSAQDCNSNGLLDVCEGATVYVNASVSGGKDDGTSWGDAYSRLREALHYADACVNSEIWVAEGTYTPGLTLYDSFRMAAGVGIYGGFAGGETSLGERDIETNVTVLSGDLPTLHDTVHVVKAELDVDSTGVLDGFRITGGRADWDTGTGFSGGGLWVKAGAAPTIRNCAFVDNDAADRGGAAYLQGGATLEGCTFEDNGHTTFSAFSPHIA